MSEIDLTPLSSALEKYIPLDIHSCESARICYHEVHVLVYIDFLPLEYYEGIDENEYESCCKQHERKPPWKALKEKKHYD